MVGCVFVSCGEKEAEGAKEEVVSEPEMREAPIAHSDAIPDPVTAAHEFVGSESCRGCHEKEFGEWQQSHHHMAMAEPSKETVVGNFDNTEFEHFGHVWKFSMQDGKYFVNAEDKDGERKDFEVAYTFGIEPLQQYLLPAEGGRLQALQVCWDARPEEEGGQRWYHLYPDEEIPPDDILHWTRQHFNWNYMCADCHSTDLQKNFDPQEGVYDTTWAEMNVACESCHGPGSEHNAWAEGLGENWDPDDYEGDMGLTVKLKEENEGAWGIDPETGQPKRTIPLASNVQAETCAPCHAHRRLMQGGSAVVGSGDLLNSHVPSVLEEALYHPDGQIEEEVYVYGSFIQSKMYHNGVRCTDCHHPHTMKTYVADNTLCTKCHQAGKYDVVEHHFHPPGGGGANCVDCHMPGKLYMGVDFRRDHSFRVPRPDLSDKMGSPNACVICHDDQDNAWAAAASKEWWGDLSEKHGEHYGEAIHAAQTGQAGADQGLALLARDLEKPALARASALSLIANRAPNPGGLSAAAGALTDEDALVRVEAIQALAEIDPAQRVQFLEPMLDDAVKAVRVEAARALAAVPAMRAKPAFLAAKEEFIKAQMAVSDRASGHMGLALLLTDLGDSAAAESAYRDAIRVEPEYVPVRINLSEMLHSQGRTMEAGPLLEDGVKLDGSNGMAHEALGRHYVRIRNYDGALTSLAKAAELMPENPGTQFFYGVALHSMGKGSEAIAPLERAVVLAPRHAEYLSGLATIARDLGEIEVAIRAAEKLVALEPENPGYRGLLDSLKSSR